MFHQVFIYDTPGEVDSEQPPDDLISTCQSPETLKHDPNTFVEESETLNMEYECFKIQEGKSDPMCLDQPMELDMKIDPVIALPSNFIPNLLSDANLKVTDNIKREMEESKTDVYQSLPTWSDQMMKLEVKTEPLKIESSSVIVDLVPEIESKIIQNSNYQEQSKVEENCPEQADNCVIFHHEEQDNQADSELNLQLHTEETMPAAETSRTVEEKEMFLRCLLNPTYDVKNNKSISISKENRASLDNKVTTVSHLTPTSNQLPTLIVIEDPVSEYITSDIICQGQKNLTTKEQDTLASSPSLSETDDDSCSDWEQEYLLSKNISKSCKQTVLSSKKPLNKVNNSCNSISSQIRTVLTSDPIQVSSNLNSGTSYAAVPNVQNKQTDKRDNKICGKSDTAETNLEKRAPQIKGKEDNSQLYFILQVSTENNINSISNNDSLHCNSLSIVEKKNRYPIILPKAKITSPRDDDNPFSFNESFSQDEIQDAIGLQKKLNNTYNTQQTLLYNARKLINTKNLKDGKTLKESFQTSSGSKELFQTSCGSKPSEVTKEPFKGEKCKQTFNLENNVTSRGKYTGLASGIARKRPLTHQCDICGKLFTGSVKLQSHMNTHTNAKPHKCSDCNKGFNSKTTLLMHRQHTHQNMQRIHYLCRFCGYRTFNKPHFDAHEKTHLLSEGEEISKPFKCEKCSKRFISNFSLGRHKVNHKPRKCSQCSESFPTRTGLYKHLDSVHNIVKFRKCNICNKEFKYSTSLPSHKKSHSTVLSFFCDMCDKGFKKKAHIEQHMITHSDERPIPCPDCDERFKRKTHLKQHAASFHGKGVKQKSKLKG